MAHEFEEIERVMEILGRLPEREKDLEHRNMWNIRENYEVSAEKRRGMRDAWFAGILARGEKLGI